jgi:hypothetical protein
LIGKLDGSSGVQIDCSCESECVWPLGRGGLIAVRTVESERRFFAVVVRRLDSWRYAAGGSARS